MLCGMMVPDWSRQKHRFLVPTLRVGMLCGRSAAFRSIPRGLPPRPAVPRRKAPQYEPSSAEECNPFAGCYRRPQSGRGDFPRGAWERESGFSIFLAPTLRVGMLCGRSAAFRQYPHEDCRPAVPRRNAPQYKPSPRKNATLSRDAIEGRGAAESVPTPSVGTRIWFFNFPRSHAPRGNALRPLRGLPQYPTRSAAHAAPAGKPRNMNLPPRRMQPFPRDAIEGRRAAAEHSHAERGNESDFALAPSHNDL